jgi:tetratricopeptide (TPR) repeat protein
MDDRQISRMALLFERALAVPAELRDRFLHEECQDDRALRDELASLLEAHDTASDYFDRLAEVVLTPALAVLAEGASGFLAAGETVSHYRIEERLGAGGMGVVYKARDLRLDRFVALKFLSPRHSSEDGARARLLIEAKAASSLDHPNIAVVHEIGEAADGGLFIAMGWYEGETLREKLRRDAVAVAEAIGIARQLASALGAAHGAGIIHRDVKPSNILITAGGVAKLLDFGIARLAGSELTADGSTPGTVAYMSPEQARGEAVDQRTDLWSLGVVLYEMLAGRRPFGGEVEQARIYAIRHDEPARLIDLRPDVPPWLAHVVETCLRKDTALRYPSADALLEDLEAGAEGTAAQRPARRPRPRRPLERGSFRFRPSRRAGVAAVTVALAVGGLAFHFDSTRSPRVALTAERVLVAPFENRTGDLLLDPVGSMAADWIIQGLAQTGVVDVVPMTAALTAYRFVAGAGGRVDPATGIDMLAAETGAGIVVSGALYRQGDSLYLQATVTDVLQRRVLSALAPIATPVDGPMAGVQELRERLMGVVAPRFNPRTEHHAGGGGGHPPSFDAYRAHAEGMERFISGDWPAATSRFMEAAGHDSTFTIPLVYAGMALSNMGRFAPVDSILVLLRPRLHLLGEFERVGFAMLDAIVRGDLLAQYEAQRPVPRIAPGTLAHFGLGQAAGRVNRPREAVRVLRQVDPERGELRGWFWYWRPLADAHHLLGEHRRELRVARRARDLFPDQPEAVRLEVSALAALGRTRAVRDLLAEHTAGSEHAASLVRHAGLELIIHGYRAEGESLLRASLERELDRPRDGSRLFRAEGHYLVGEWDAAEALLRELAADFPESIRVNGGLGILAARRGDRAGALAADRWLAELDRPYLHGANTYWRARIASLLGEREEAVHLLRQAWLEGAFVLELVHTELDFAPLHDYPPYQEVIRPKG